MLVLSGPTAEITRLAFSPDGKILAAYGPLAGMSLRTLPDGGRLPWDGGMYVYDAPAFHPTKPLCFVEARAKIDSGIGVIDLKTGKTSLARIGRQGQDEIRLPTVTADGKAFVCDFSGIFRDHELRLLRWKPGEALQTEWKVSIEPLSKKKTETTRTAAIAVAPDGTRFATLDAVRSRTTRDERPMRVTVRSLKDGKVHAAAELPAGTAPMLAFPPDRHSLVTRRATVLNVWSGDDLSVREVSGGGRARVTGFAFHPSGHLLAATTNDGSVMLYDTATWKPANTLTWKIGKLRSIAFSPNGLLAAAGSDTGKVVVWDVDV